MSRRKIRTGRLLRAGSVLTALVAAGSVFAQTPIENDDCQNATPITDGTYFGTTVGAEDDGDAGCGNASFSPDVWYLYTATCDGTAAVDTCTSHPFDTNLSIQAPDCSGDEVACSEDDCGPAGMAWQSSVQFRVVEGDQKLIRVSGWGGAAGDFELHVSCTTTLRPPNDDCENAFRVTPGSIVLGSTEALAGENLETNDRAGTRNVCGMIFGNDSFQAPGVWYEVTGTGHRMTASTCNPGTDFDTLLAVFCAGCDRLICVDGNDIGFYPQTGDHPECISSEGLRSSVSWCSRVGQKYLIWVHGWSTGRFELSIEDGAPCFDAVDCIPVEAVDAHLVDNGDDDGWADTNETVDMQLRVTNRSAVDVTGLVAHVEKGNDPRIACVGGSAIHIGTLRAGETRLTRGAVNFRVADVDRTTNMLGADDDLAASFRVRFASDQFEDQAPRCSRSGEPCSLAGELCQQHDVCERKHCLITGNPCINDRTCNAEDGGNLCVGRCTKDDVLCFPGRSEPVLGQFAPECAGPDICVDETQSLTIDLDLDTTGGSGPTTFFEGFESGDFGAFTEMNLDAGLSDPAASDGYRCQYTDPDYELSNSYGSSQACYLGIDSAQADAYYWHTDDDRSFSGLRSLHMGVDLESGEYTTPLQTLEAVASSEPINIGPGRACSLTTARSCLVDTDCPANEQCRAASPELTFKHQVSLVDNRELNFALGGAADRGVVQIQLADGEGNAMGPWRNLEPWFNRYDSLNILGGKPLCVFDPVDDGNTEDDFFDSNLRNGPSSTCYPQWTFASAGDTDDPFDPTNLNGPVQGPGLQGETGPGTWIESRISLDRFRGRRVRLRFLTTSLRFQAQLWSNANVLYPGSATDDGWWIDDVTVTHTLVDPVTLVPDDKDNSGLGIDTDGDCIADSVDCRVGDERYWASPGEVTDLRLLHSGGAGGTTTLTWGPPTDLGGESVDFVMIVRDGSTCAESDEGPDSTTTHTGTPAPGQMFEFLIQAENPCGRGTLGTDSSANSRTACS